MRYDKGTIDGRWINVHLLVSPEDPDHLDELNRFLSRLRLNAMGDSFACTKTELIVFGKRVDSTIVDDRAALAKGCEQVKVNFEQLQDEYSNSDWARENILIAVSGTRTDGTSGMDRGAGDTLRAELEKGAHCIFASSPAQRAFWIGDGAATVEHLWERYRGPKPCIHGCDAHKLADVAVPDDERYTWIKGVVSFDTLRQARIDPKGRAFVGPEAPISPIPSQTIASVEFIGATWAKTPKIEFNPGLVAIIGARGSGKSALAEMTALACDSIPDERSERSFLHRAAEVLHGTSARLVWGSGELAERRPGNEHSGDADRDPRSRYLSQQFVEELCASDRMTDRLLEEIQRVIFQAHPLSDREGTSTFEELLDLRVAVLRDDRRREESALGQLSERIGTDHEKQTQIPAIRSAAVKKVQLIRRYKADRKKLVAKGREERVKHLEALTQAADKVRGYLKYYANQRQSLLALKQAVTEHRTRTAPEALREAKLQYKGSGLKEADWEHFLLKYKGDVDAAIAAYQDQNQKQITAWKGTAPADDVDPDVPLIASEEKIDEQPLATLEAEIARVQRQVNIDKDTVNRFTTVSNRIDEERTALTGLKETLSDCKGAADRIKAAKHDRDAAYAEVFNSIAAEERELGAIYAPLRARLESSTATIQKLSFAVKRSVDVESWAARGEKLLDLRRLTPFKNRGTLLEVANESLAAAWESGDSMAVAAAMSVFVDAHLKELPKPSSLPPSEQANYRGWLKRFAKWLYSTDHISLQYSIDYEGVDIRKLSPGTRGIVLLLLYLALDDKDDRPLIIDQPEENLDPKSVNDELVPLFQAAKAKRQIILVTHNANLVVNTDADQVIVAQAGAHAPGQLPPITYTSGGLEVAEIRKLVCDILEGGEEAFRERARRLRVHLTR
jgi:ABC-type lipoprotein export system ATPase subunit